MTKNYTLVKIGKKVREFRNEKNLKLIEVASKAGISKGLLSKIENGRTIPSLPVLLQIVKALEVDLSSFFEGVEESASYQFIHCKKEDYQALQKEDSVGFNYFSIMNDSFSNIAFQTALLELSPNAQREKVTTDGYEFLYLLDGEVDYWLGQEAVSLNTGDSLFFNGRIPHVPQNKTNKVARILVIYMLTADKSE